MAAFATLFGREGPFAIVTFAAELSGVNLGHFNLDRTLLHFGKGIGIVTFFAFHSRISVNFS